MKADAAGAIAAAALVALGAVAAPPAAARDLTGDGSVVLRSAVTSTFVGSRAPDDPLLFPERDADVTLWRIRLAPEARPFAWMTVEAAVEERIRQPSSAGASAGFGALPAEPPPPYRLTPIDGLVARTSGGSTWHQELDRASIALHLPSTEVTAGRQAIGLGRGVFFGAVDVLAPLGPLEIDRQWRRGVDALHVETRFGRRLSADAVAAAGDSVDRSAFAARVRGYAGPVDAELIGGRRARDVFGGLSASATVGDAEVHGEAALFRAPDPLPAPGDFGDDRLAAKAMLGGSYRFDVGRGLAALAEWHYSGFGARRARDIPALLADPRFQERLARGDTQILGRHAAAISLSYPIADTVTLSALALGSPADGSGVAGPSVEWSASDALSLSAGAWLPFGARPSGLTFRSEYGVAPATVFLQLRLYD